MGTNGDKIRILKEEIEEAEKLFNIIDIKKINVPQLNAQRHLIIMAPNNETGIYG